MSYYLLLKELKSGYRFVEESKFNVRLTHSPGKQIRILPYKASSPKDAYEHFKMILGQFSRLASKKERQLDLQLEELINLVVERVNTNQSSDSLKFRSILQTLFVDDQGELEVFHPVIFNYFSVEKKKEQAQLAEFLYSILWSDQLEAPFLEMYRQVPSNLLLRLVYEALPKLETIQNKKSSSFANLVPEVVTLFQEDMMFLMQHNQLFMENFERLIRYYYFFYVSQLAIRLNQMFNATSQVMPLYFNLDWESTSRSRTSYNEGWRRLESALKPLFSHANTLEMLNYHNLEARFSYVELREQFNALSPEERHIVEGQLDTLISAYQEHVQDVPWDRFSFTQPPFMDSLEQKVLQLYRVIDFQFTVSVRKKPHSDYQSWFTEYCKKFFLRRRSSLGYTLNMTEDDLMFMTRICMKNHDKIRLVKLFEEYENRGILFDRDSRDRIVILFEKLNLLEKKSDSGDAQYVKSIL